mmetsp:Transcript_30523/g.61522  ORF Transcript_30523/g.61522 Transcript_30523/m.61522 type:complete len:380 (-) Transcript_30523:4931-6070(-)
MGFSLFFDSGDQFLKRLNLQYFRKFPTKFFRNNSKIPFLTLKKWWEMDQKRRKKKIRFKKVQNNGTHRNLNLILDLKKIFCNQLPNMPTSYISRIVFDKKNESIVLQKCEGTIFQTIGGCCYRPLKKKQVSELIFFAITTQEQGKGFGKQLLNFLKEYHLSTQVKYIITCADNNAVKFFSKQGFSPRVTAPRSLWAGYIKDYEETILMECILTPFFSCISSNLSMIILEFFFFNKFKKFLVLFSTGKKEQVRNKNSPKGFFHITSKISDNHVRKIFLQTLGRFLSEIKKNNFSKPFLEPVNISFTGAKDYFQKVSNATDLRSVEEKIRFEKFFYGYEIFFSIIKKMVKNCQNYNNIYHSISQTSYQLERNVTLWNLSSQ